MTGHSVPQLLVVLATALVVVSVLVWPGRPAPSGAAATGRQGGGSGRSDAPRVGEPGRPSAHGRRPVHGLRPDRRRRAARELEAAEDGLADLLGLVAAPLRAGVPAALSLAAGSAAAEGDPLLRALVDDLVAAGASGREVSDTWLEHGRRLDSSSLAFVGQAWALSERTGAPLADALRASEEVLRARTRSRERLASAAAGPRASMGVLALLPLSGPVVGMACGVGPRQLYFSTTWSTVSLVVGIAFAGFGWWWSRAILERSA